MRLKLGPALGVFTVSPRPAPGPNPTPVAKNDVEVSIVGLSVDVEPIQCHVSFPAYDLATHNRLLRVYAVFVPQGQPSPGDAEAFLKSNLPMGQVDVSTIQDGNGGSPVVIQIAGVPEGPATGQIILGFDDGPVSPPSVVAVAP